MKKEINILLIAIISFLFVINVSTALTYNPAENITSDTAEGNKSCNGDVCSITAEANDSEFEEYTYEENMNPKCYYNLNFCNLGYNVTSNTDAVGVINLLKQVNYQMQDELKISQTNTANYQRQIKEKNFLSLFLFVILLISIVWNLYLTFRRHT